MEKDFQQILPGLLSGGLGYEEKCIDSMRFLGMQKRNQKNFPTHGGIYKLEKIQQAFWREIKP